MQRIRMNTEASTSDSISSVDQEWYTESSIDSDDEDDGASLLETDSRAPISKRHSRKSWTKFYKKIQNSTSTSDSDSSSDWDDAEDHNSLPETDFHYSSQESVELGNVRESSTTSDEYTGDLSDLAISNSDNWSTTSDELIEDFDLALSSEGQSHEEYSSSTSDTYKSSDYENSSKKKFSHRFSRFGLIVNDHGLDEPTQQKTITCTCTSPKASSNTSLKKSTGEIVLSSARSKEQESEDKDNLFETRAKLDYFSQDNFANNEDTNSTTATTRNSKANHETATCADRVNDSVNFLPEEQCRMRLDILLRLKDILQEIVSDYKENETDGCTDIEKRISEIITSKENMLKEQVPPDLLKSMSEGITYHKLDEYDSPSASISNEISRIPVSVQSNSNCDDEQATDDSSDSGDDRSVDSPEQYEQYFDKHHTFIEQFKSSRRTQPHSWRNNISSQLRKNWAQSIAYTAETQIELIPGKEINHKGVKMYAEGLENDVFYFRATSEVEYSNMLCDIHSDIGNGRMFKSEYENLMFLAYDQS